MVVQRVARLQDPEIRDEPSPLVLLCKSQDGYHLLSRLLTRAYLEGRLSDASQARLRERPVDFPSELSR